MMITLVSAGAVQQKAITTSGMKMSRDEEPNARSTGWVVTSANPMDAEKMTTRQIGYSKSNNVYKV